MKKVYLSGPITNKPNDNAELFKQAEDRLRDAGYNVYNPVAKSYLVDFNCSVALGRQAEYKDYIAADISKLRNCDVMMLLPEWQLSWGCMYEILFAIKMGIPIVDCNSEPENTVELLIHCTNFISKNM